MEKFRNYVGLVLCLCIVTTVSTAQRKVETIEGTDACIRRGGMLARGGAVVVKTAKPDQDLRFDVPAVGLETLHSMMETGCKVLAIEAYRTLFVEKTSVLKEADCAGIAILSVEQEHL